MGYDFWTSKTVKARKVYVCCECGAQIAIGELHSYGAGKTEGYMVDQRLCLTCDLIITEGFMADLWDDEGFPMGSVRSELRSEYGIEDAFVWATEHRATRLAAADERKAAKKLADARAGVLAEVAQERQRQVEGEGWTPEHDDAHRDGELAMAAAVYASYPRAPIFRVVCWPWKDGWFKPGSLRRNLIKAAALIVAEIERLDRAADASAARAEGA